VYKLKTGIVIMPFAGRN